MSILTRPLLHVAERFDLEDFNLLLSAIRTDSHFYTKRLISDKAYVFQGFVISQSYIGQPTANVTLTNSTLINGNNTGDVSWWTAPESASPLTLPTGVGGLQGGRNYVELQVYTQDGTALQRAFWDPSANSGEGVEFSQEVDTVTELFIQVQINQTGFNSGNNNLIPLAIIDLDGSLNIRGIRDKRDLMFRLGQPGNIDASFAWGTKTEPGTILTFVTPSGTPFVAGETITFASGATATVITGGTNGITVFDFSNDNLNTGDLVTGGTSGSTASLLSYYESFSGADKNIRNYRDMFAALMNEIRLVKGTRFWYETGAAISLPSVLNYLNTMIVPISSGARFMWTGSAFKITDNSTSGQATSDVVAAIRIPGFTDNLYLTREDGSGGSASISIPDQAILYVELPSSGSRTFSESGPGVTNFRVVDIGDFLPSDKNFVLAYREGTKVIVKGLGELEAGESVEVGDAVSKELLAFIGAESDVSTNPQYTSLPNADLSNQFTTNDSLTQAISINAANINDIVDALLNPYQELLTVVSGAPANDNEVTGPLSSGATFTIPLDSRDMNAQKQYKVGQGGLMIFLNGQHLTLGEDYSEVGISGDLSFTVEILQNLVVGDELDIRVLIPQFFGTAGDDQPFFVNYIFGQNGAQIPVGDLYNSGTNRLQIWRNGLIMLKTNSVGDDIDQYAEPNNNSISLTQSANPDEIFVMMNNQAPNPTVTLLTGVSGTVITIPAYVIGTGALEVYRNGVLLTTLNTAPTDLKYVETSTTSITLSLAAGVSDVFKIFKASTPPQWRERLTGVTGTSITIPNSQTFTPGDPRLIVFRNGLFMYNSTTIGTAVERYQENGTTGITIETAASLTDVFEWIYV